MELNQIKQIAKQYWKSKMIHTFVDNLEKIDKPLFFKRISLSYFRNEDRDDETASILTFVGQVRL